MSPTRALSFAFVLALVALLAYGPAASAEEKVFENCKVVKVEGAKLRLTDPKGNEHAPEVASDAKITVDGKEVKLADLPAGTKIKITVSKDGGSPVVLKIEGTTK